MINFFTYLFVFFARFFLLSMLIVLEFSRAKSEDMIYCKLQRWRRRQRPTLPAADLHVDKASIFPLLLFLLIVRKAINHINHFYTISAFSASVERDEKLECVRTSFVFRSRKGAKNYESYFCFGIFSPIAFGSSVQLMKKFQQKISLNLKRSGYVELMFQIQQIFQWISIKTPEVRLCWLFFFILFHFELTQTERCSSAPSTCYRETESRHRRTSRLS